MTAWTDAAIIAAALLALAAYFRNLRSDLAQSLEGLGGRVDEVGAGLQRRLDDLVSVTQLNTQALSTLLPSVILREDAQANRQTLDTLVAKLLDALTATIAHEREWENPLTSEEVQRLQDYQERLTVGAALTPEALSDMKGLADRVHAERPDDASSLALGLLAALFFALIASKPSSKT